MDNIGKNGAVITLCGMDFDIPQRDCIFPWDFKKDKKESELWLNHYHTENGETTCSQYCLKRHPYNKFTLDDRVLKGVDKETASVLME